MDGTTPPPATAPADRSSASAGPPPARSGGPGAVTAFDPRALTDGQLDELTHRLIGPLTRLLRGELRGDRERIGQLRDARR
ncbi:hypothetical protein DCW30_14890 [Streptomyces alfalfae]|uniref:Extensin n=1 Tax=Streptomyces alfalfae TaxID=1642299 RepID=A0ABM6GMX4_9ACTN|nr:hypothetical protein [Streptomyces alfalfae]APY85117.1 hypothetical protein A7J05_04675 [Streptomyces alfalfae]AYA15462.1 hypothetical protein D3X13_03690 [Streptomyces fradiae]RXX43874.1 hypothetical protein DCW30_14890 [Streptomyces alfalfae]